MELCGQLIQGTLKAPTKCLFLDHILKVSVINDSLG